MLVIGISRIKISKPTILFFIIIGRNSKQWQINDDINIIHACDSVSEK